MRPQKAQMAQNDRNHLDEAIDTISAQMTAVADDHDLSQRIVSSLPERSTWSMHWLMPRLAVLAMFVVASVVWNSRSAPAELAPLVSLPAPSAMTTLHASIEAEPNRTTPLERLERLEPVEPVEAVVPRPDHEFSLPALVVVALLEDEPLIVAPLAIADLPALNDFPR